MVETQKLDRDKLDLDLLCFKRTSVRTFYVQASGALQPFFSVQGHDAFAGDVLLPGGP